MKHLSLKVYTSSEAADLVAFLLMEEGAEGANISDANDVKEVLSSGSWDYADDSLYNNNIEVFVTAVFDLDYDLSGLEARLKTLKEHSPFECGSLHFESKIIDSNDYENEWKKYYNPIEVGRLLLIPAWLSDQTKPDKINVIMNPGKAFGTGNHETTLMCLQLLEGLPQDKIEGKRVLDVGCGSGILGIAALMLGTTYCVMSDIDIQAVEATNENVQLNNLQNRCKIIHGGFDAGFTGDIILANLTAGILLDLKDKLIDSLNADGIMILSGIIDGREQEIISAFSKLELIEHKNMGEWHSLLLQKRTV